MYEQSIRFRTARNPRLDGNRSDKGPFVVDGDASSVSNAAEQQRKAARCPRGKPRLHSDGFGGKAKAGAHNLRRGVEIAVQPHNKRGEPRRIAF